jgi:hypothetical protein
MTYSRAGPGADTGASRSAWLETHSRWTGPGPPATTSAGSFYSDDLKPSVVISHRLWRDYYGSAPDVAGATIRIDSKPLTIIGVAPVGFRGASILARSEVWLPIGANGEDLSPLPALLSNHRD